MDRFEPPRSLRLGNRLVTPLIRMGLPMGVKRAPMALLTVNGRKSGLPRTAPVALARHGEGWLIVAVYGESDWSRNLGAAGEATITRRRKTTWVEATRLQPGEGGPILRDEICGAPRLVRRMTAPYFEAGFDSPLTAWEEEARSHPIFVLNPIRAVPSAPRPAS